MCRQHKRVEDRAAVAVLAACLLFGGASASAQSADSNELSAYTNAVARVRPADRLEQLEQFAVHARPGPLKVAALEFVIWQYLRERRDAQALTWANELARTDPNNGIALALLSKDARRAVDSGARKPAKLLAMASHGLDNVPQLQRPLGMSPADFVQLTQRASAMLNGAAGWAEVRMKDYVAARVYLHNAVASDPNHAQNVYALADLDGPHANPNEGYWYLAQAVSLSHGTSQGVEIAQFARARYVKDGGSTGDWNQFLASAGSPSAASPGTAVMASVKPPAAVARPPAKVTQPAPTMATNRPTVTQPGNSQPVPSVWSDDSMPVVPKRRVASATGPMSLGILVETSLASKGNRSPVVNSLIDMLRRMNDRDEAFVLTYENNLVFAQDLTSDPEQLEQAMENIKPQKGAVLDDAIAFAAGHLARIAKYPNRVLLVISDGRNVDSRASSLETSAEINAAGVRIFCIGVDVSQAEGRYRLQALAASTGGESSFIGSTAQFRNATREMAQNMGIDFRF